jgi:hypothetical protein
LPSGLRQKSSLSRREPRPAGRVGTVSVVE